MRISNRQIYYKVRKLTLEQTLIKEIKKQNN